MRFKVVICLAHLLLTSHLMANDLQVSLNSIWRTNHYLDAAFDEQGYLLASFDHGVDVFLPTPDQPLQKIGSLVFEQHQPKQILTQGRFAYLLTNQALLTVDLNDLQQPLLVSELPYGGSNAQRVGDTLYIFGKTSHVLDLADPASPTLRSQYSLAETPVFGQVIENYMVTMENFTRIRSYDILLNDQLRQVDFLEIRTADLNSRPVVIGNRLFFSNGALYFDSSIRAVDVAGDGTLENRGISYPRITIDRLASWNNQLLVTGFSNQFSGLQLYQPGTGETLLGELLSLPLGDVHTAVPATDKMFFGLNKQGDILQFRPDASFSIATTYSGEQAILDMAFDGTHAFLASTNYLRVLSFDDPTNPKLVTTIDGLVGLQQKLLFKKGELHLASQSQYRRYRLEEQGKLSLVYEMDLSLENPIVALGFEQDNAFVVTRNQLAIINQSPTDQFPALRMFEFEILPILGAAFKNDLVFLDFFGEFKVFRLSQQSTLDHIATQRLQHEKHEHQSITLNGHILTARNDLFDISTPENPLFLAKTAFTFKSSYVVDNTLYGIGNEGFRIFDIRDPKHPQLQWESPAYKGDRIFLFGQHALIFQQQPNTLTHLTMSSSPHTWLFPFVRNDPIYDSQLNFFNSGNQQIEAQLRVVDNEGTPFQDTFVVQPGETIIKQSGELSPKGLAFNVKIQAPQSLIPSISTREFSPQETITSSSQTQALSSSELTNELVLDLLNPDDEVFLGVSQADDGPPISLAIRIVGTENRPGPRITLATNEGPVLLPLKLIFSRDDLGTGVSIVCQAPSGRKIGGYIFTQGRSGKPGLSISQAVGTSNLNPTTLAKRGSFGHASQYQEMVASEDRLILAGQSGIFIHQASNPENITEWSVPANDAAPVGEHLWILTPGRLECHSIDKQGVLVSLPVPKTAERMAHSGKYLFLFGPRFDGALMIDIGIPNNPSQSHHLPALRRVVNDVIVKGEIAYLATQANVQMYDQLDQPNANDLGMLPLSRSFNQLFFHQNRLIGADRFSLSIWEIEPGLIPDRRRSIQARGLMDVNQNRSLLINTQDNTVRIADLEFFGGGTSIPVTPGFNPTEGRLRGHSLWLRDKHNRIQYFDIRDLEAPALRLDLGRQVFAQHVTTDGDITYATSVQGTQGFLHKIRIGDDQLDSQTFALGSSEPRDLAVKDGFVLVADRQLGLATYFLEDDGSATLVNSLGPSADRLILQDTYAYTHGEGSMLDIYDVSQPMAPIHLSHVPFICCDSSFVPPSHPNGLQVDGTYAFVHEFDKGPQVFNINNPNAPVRVGGFEYDPFGTYQGKDFVYRDSYGYVANLRTTDILDFSEPSQPRKIGEIEGYSKLLAIQDDMLFIAQFDALKIYDISDPSTPVISGEYHGVKATQLEPAGEYLWVTTETSIEQFRIRQPIASIPWAVNNTAFQTRIQITNLSMESARVQLLAVRPDGKEITKQLTFEGRSTQNYAVESLFPGWNGYAILVEGSAKDLSVSFATYQALQVFSRPGPALAKAIPSHQYRDGLVLSFPDTDATHAFVLQAPLNQGMTRVRMKLHTTSGETVEVPLELQDYRPLPVVLQNLLPIGFIEAIPSLTFETWDGTPLTGVSFSFTKGEAATGAGSNQPAFNFAP